MSTLVRPLCFSLCAYFVFSSILSSYASAKELIVFDVRKNLVMSDSEPTYKDFYVNAGVEEGIKVGMVITVKRKHTLYDYYQNKSPVDLYLSVGELRIIHVEKGVSVARLEQIYSREDRPMLNYNSIIIGDRLDITTAKMKKKEPRKPAGSTSVAPSLKQEVGATKEALPPVAPSLKQEVGATKEALPPVAPSLKQEVGATKEALPPVAPSLKQEVGATKEALLSVAPSLKQKAGATKEALPPVAPSLKQKAGATKEALLSVAPSLKQKAGATKEALPPVQEVQPPVEVSIE